MSRHRLVPHRHRLSAAPETLHLLHDQTRLLQWWLENHTDWRQVHKISREPILTHRGRVYGSGGQPPASKILHDGCPRLLIATNNKPLVEILGSKGLADINSPHLVRLKEKAMAFNFDVVHIAGKDPDAMSRIFAKSTTVGSGQHTVVPHPACHHEQPLCHRPRDPGGHQCGREGHLTG